MTGGGPTAVLRSAYDHGARTVSIELEPASGPTDTIAAGWRLAFTSIVQLTPAGTDAVLTDRLATYHELAPDPAGALEAGSRWRTELATAHALQHANDGPASAYVITATGATIEVRVEPTIRVGDDSTAPEPIDDRQLPDNLVPLLPHPVTIECSGTSARRTAHLADGSPDAADAWRAVAGLAERVCGRPLLLDGGTAESVAVVLADADLDPDVVGDAYTLTIVDDAVMIGASTPAGFRHGFTTLAQWLAAGLPEHAEVSDRPRYPWRGLHLDLARQWFEPSVVAHLIDHLAWRKMSHLHLHLTDDEGWRIPVTGYAELAESAATRGHGRALPPMLGGSAEPIGRVYTPDEIEAWVHRADELGVVLVPEVDLPAHMHAALTAVPRLRDPADRSQAQSVQHFTDNAIVPGHPETTPFVEAVLDAVCELFPSSPYIHIGGDEVADGAWSASPVVADYLSRIGGSTTADAEAGFHRDVVAALHARGRRVGAWQEAAESGGVRPGDGYAVGWRTFEANRTLAAAGHDVVVSPGQAYYLDMAVDAGWSTPGMGWAGSTSLDDVCDFDPDAGWSEDERAHLLGVQGCLWTEHVRDEATMYERLGARLDAIAERGWTGSIVGGAASLAARSAVVADAVDT